LFSLKARIIVAVVFLPLIFILLYHLPPYYLAGAMSIVCAVSAYELLRAIWGNGKIRIRIYAAFSAAIIPVGEYFEMSSLVFPAVFLVLLSLMFVESIVAFESKRQITFSQILITLFGGALIPLLLSSLVSLKLMPEGHLLVLIPVISAFLTDAGAYFSGKFLGRHKAFPLVSPNKTVEGCIGGLVVGTASILVLGIVISLNTPLEVRFWALVPYGFAGAAVTQLGDLAFSLIKREFDVKDYGRLLPGHGGMLDRFDSMCFTAPMIFLLISFAPAVVV